MRKIAVLMNVSLKILLTGHGSDNVTIISTELLFTQSSKMTTPETNGELLGKCSVIYLFIYLFIYY